MYKKILIFAIFIIMSFMCSSCNNKEKALTREELHEKEGIPVEVVTVKKGDILVTVITNGELKADDAITVSTDNKGIIKEVCVKEGQYVKAQDPVAVIEPDNLQDQTFQAQVNLNAALTRLSQAQSNAMLLENQVEAAIRQAEAGVKGAEAQYSQAEAALEASKESLSIIEEGARSQEIARAEQDVIKAKAQLEEIEIDLGRMKRLYEQSIVSKQNLEVAQVKYDVAMSEYKSFQEQLDLVKEGARNQEKEAAKQQVKIAQAALRNCLSSINQAKELLKIEQSKRIQVKVAYQSVDVAKSEVEQAKTGLAIIKRNLQKAFIKAPISGYVTKLYVKKGEYTSSMSTTSLIDIFEPSSLYFEGIVSETDINNINQGLSVNIKVDGIPDKVFTGYVKEIIPQASESRQFTIKVTVSEPGKGLKPGMFARGTILLAAHKNVPVIPNNCIKTKDNKTYVFIAKEKKAIKQEIKQGPSMNDKSEIFTGLKEGDIVISSGFVKDGDTINIINEE